MSTESGALRARALLFVVVLPLLLSACRPRVVATVNGKPIREQEFFERCVSALPQGPSESVGAQVLRTMVIARLVEEELRKAGQLPTDNEVRAVVDAQRAMDELRTGRSYQEILQQQGRTEQDVFEDVRTTLLIHRFLHQGVEVSDQEVLDYYRQNEARMTMPPRVRISLIRTRDRKEIDRIKRELDNRAPFEVMARDKANIGGTLEMDGRIPAEFTPDSQDLEPQVIQAAFKLDVGEYTEPIQAGPTWVIVKLDDKKPEMKPDFNRIRPILKMQVEQEKGAERRIERERALAELIRNADIKIQRKELAGLIQLMQQSAVPPAPPDGGEPHAHPPGQPHDHPH